MADALIRLDRTAVQVAGVVAVLGLRATPSQVEQALGRSGEVPAGHAQQALHRLAEHGLAWPDRAGGSWQVPKAVTRLAGGILGLGPSLVHVAPRVVFADLRRAAGLLGHGPVRSVSDAAGALCRVVTDDDQLRRLLDTAPASVHGVLERFAADGPQRLAPADAVDWLRDRCLLLEDESGLRTVPAELVRLARGARVVGVVRVAPPVVAVAEPSADPALQLVGRLRALLAAVEARPLETLQSGGVACRSSDAWPRRSSSSSRPPAAAVAVR